MFKIIKTAFNNSLIKNNYSLSYNNTLKTNFQPERTISSNFPKFLIIMKERRKRAGPDRLRKRSEWPEWNYKSELFAFSKRLQENISENTLKTAFTHKSYIEAEERKRKEMGVPVQDVALNLVPNTELIAIGSDTINTYVQGFIRYCYPYLPEEGVESVHNHLLSNNVLAYVSTHIGTLDLILSEDFPVSKNTLASTLRAIVGAIRVDDTERRAHLFIHDFICAQLVAKDIFNLWEISNPLQLVDVLLKRHGREPSESRLAFESGRNTLESIFQVALFSDKVFLGQGIGETLSISEEMAAYDVLRRLFRVTGIEKPLPFGKDARDLNINLQTENAKLSDWYDEKFEEKTKPLV